MNSQEYLTFIQTPSYAKAAKRLIVDDLQREIELTICADPECGKLEAGVRKVRIALPGKGKRGGARVVYYHIARKGKVYLLDLFAKNEKTALTNAEKNEVRELTKELEKDQ